MWWCNGRAMWINYLWLYTPTYYRKCRHNSLRSITLTMAALWLECGRRHKHEIDTFSACEPEQRRPNICQFLSGNWAQNSEIYCDTHKLRKLANFIYSVFLKITFETCNTDGNFKLAVSYFGTPGLHYYIRNRDVLLPERTRGRPWGRLRVRIRSIEKTSSWKFYPAAQNFTNRMLFRNTYIFKTI